MPDLIQQRLRPESAGSVTVATTTLDHPPRLSRLYGRAALTAVLPGGGGQLPDGEVVLPDVVVDREHLADYDRVCGFRIGDRLPPTYLHVVSFPMAVQLMARRSFPFAVPGLVHVANRITQRQRLTADDRPTLHVAVRDLRDHPKGRQFDVVARAELDGETVWTDVSTYLHRGGGDDGAPTPGPDTTLELRDDASLWEVPADTGRRYGSVSGDRNPIHLHPLTAKLFGFPRQIAHGMWTKARCLAAFEGRLPTAFTVDVGFKKPIVLPTDVAFSAEPSGDGWRFAVHRPRDGAPHLAGSVTSG